MVVEVYGTWGAGAMESLSCLASRLATSSNKAQGSGSHQPLRQAEPEPCQSKRHRHSDYRVRVTCMCVLYLLVYPMLYIETLQ